MDALLMCGGRGTRLERPAEKPLVPVAGVPMVDRVRRALEASAVDVTYAAVSPNAPETRAHLESRGVRTVETPGDGYVTDLGTALEHPSLSAPVLTVAADLPLLEAAAVDRVLRTHDGESSLTACVPVVLKRRLGASVDTRYDPAPHLAPTGVNVVGDSTRSMTTVHYDPRLAVNVNRPTDIDVAERLASDVDESGGGIEGGAENGGPDPCA